MQLAQSGHVNTRNLRKSQKTDWTYEGNLQERCFHEGKSPCGMQRARPVLLKLNSGKFQSKESISDANPIELYIDIWV